MDKYLLDEHAELIKVYSKQPHKLQTQLNAFEICCFVDILVKNDKIDLARRIGKRFKEDWSTDSSEFSREQFNETFDLVLNMNATTKQQVKNSVDRRQSNANTNTLLNQLKTK